MPKNNIYLGKSGEEIAVQFIEKNGYKVLFRNYKNRLGEIDIIAKERGTYCFIEVKTRSSDRFGLAQEALSPAKKRKLAQLALAFLKEKKLLDQKARFDVVAIVASPNGSIETELIQDAFEITGACGY
ncbi:MAG: YraN family protein [Candidatus Omnitrophica bacterium]|nr:YraN family protein [Candidatus Omnitrophota bacterium]